jgi:hypothetical protein|tara:strand:- start:346 stop:645 length:300 start_codon:yes stop_codon:yes gene_type:complete
MKRYSNTRVKIDKSDIRVYSTTYYPEIKLSDNDIFIMPKEGERLDFLAHKYYGDTTLWWIIAKANGVKGVAVPPLDEPIRIPGDITKVIQDFRKLNTVG